MQLNHIAAD